MHHLSLLKSYNVLFLKMTQDTLKTYSNSNSPIFFFLSFPGGAIKRTTLHFSPFADWIWVAKSQRYLTCCVRSKMQSSVCTLGFSLSFLPPNQRSLRSQTMQGEFSPVLKNSAGVSVFPQEYSCLCFSHPEEFQSSLLPA